MAAPKYTDVLVRACLAAALTAASHAGWCYEDGAPPAHTGGFGEPDCSACHSDHEKGAPEGLLEVSGLPASYSPGAEYTLSIVLEHPELESGGYQLALRTPDGEQAGELAPASSRSKIVSAGDVDYLSHTRDGRKTDTDGRIEWQVRWRAPENGEPVVLNIAANAANDDISALGDYVYMLEKKVGVEPQLWGRIAFFRAARTNSLSRKKKCGSTP